LTGPIPDRRDELSPSTDNHGGRGVRELDCEGSIPVRPGRLASSAGHQQQQAID
jgi:hypothetical protein